MEKNIYVKKIDGKECVRTVMCVERNINGQECVWKGI